MHKIIINKKTKIFFLYFCIIFNWLISKGNFFALQMGILLKRA